MLNSAIIGKICPFWALIQFGVGFLLFETKSVVSDTNVFQENPQKMKQRSSQASVRRQNTNKAYANQQVSCVSIKSAEKA